MENFAVWICMWKLKKVKWSVEIKTFCGINNDRGIKSD